MDDEPHRPQLPPSFVGSLADAIQGVGTALKGAPVTGLPATGSSLHGQIDNAAYTQYLQHLTSGTLAGMTSMSTQLVKVLSQSYEYANQVEEALMQSAEPPVSSAHIASFVGTTTIAEGEKPEVTPDSTNFKKHLQQGAANMETLAETLLQGIQGARLGQKMGPRGLAQTPPACTGRPSSPSIAEPDLAKPSKQPTKKRAKPEGMRNVYDRVRFILTSSQARAGRTGTSSQNTSTKHWALTAGVGIPVMGLPLTKRAYSGLQAWISLGVQACANLTRPWLLRAEAREPLGT